MTKKEIIFTTLLTISTVLAEGHKEKFINNARSYLETKYVYEGRSTDKYPGMDCMGLIFKSYEKTFGKKWYEFSVFPTQLVKNKELGEPVTNLDGKLCNEVDVSLIKEGDIVYLLSSTFRNPKENPLVNINNVDYWVWHMGIYSDREKNLFLEANPGNKVIEHSFEDILNSNEAIFVTRIN